jgi:hypothetical protein
VPAVASDKQRQQSRFPGSERPRRFQHLEARQMFELGAGAVTLDERISTVWSALVTEGRAECPVCTGPTRAAEPCPACGSELS